MSARVAGFVAGGVHCGLKKPGKADLAVIVSDRPAAVAGVFTRNRFPGAPVQVSKRHIRSGVARAAVINSRISNVATGEQGIANAREMCALVAREIGARPREVQVASTGVIGWSLPMDKLRVGIPAAIRSASASGWARASRAIMTTDTRPKLATARLGKAHLVGIAKGAGMIQPNMATMLCYLATDLAVEPACLRSALREVVASTLNAFTIDGETSTSDSAVVFANGASGNTPIAAGSRRARDVVKLLGDACLDLTEQLAKDGEGVTRLADVIVSGAASVEQARRIARRIANSVLVKTALFGGDPNWGRVIAALGTAGVPFRTRDVSVTFAGIPMLRGGQPVPDPAALRRAARAVRARRFAIEVGVGRGPGRAKLLTTDLSYEYVRVNAEYTT